MIRSYPIEAKKMPLLMPLSTKSIPWALPHTPLKGGVVSAEKVNSQEKMISPCVR